AFSSSDPRWGVLDGQGRILAGHKGDIADLRAQWNDFRLDPTATKVRFAFQLGQERPAQFSVRDRRLIANPPPDPSFIGPANPANGMTVTDWSSMPAPKLNGIVLTLYRDELARSVAVQGERVLMGGNWSLRTYDRSGKGVWDRAVPGTTWVVNISRDGKLAVAGYGDGTIRWHRMSDGY